MVTAGPAHVKTAPPRSNWWLLGMVTVLAAMVLYVFAWAQGDPTSRGLFIGPLMLLLMAPLISRVRDRQSSFDLAGIVFTAIGVKLLSAYARLWMVDTLYDGVGDSTGYHGWGQRLAPLFRNFNFDVAVGKAIPGTGWPRLLTGIVYAIFGADKFTGFIVFSMMAFLGCWFFYRAFETALPHGDHKRFALLIFFWPSLVFWPSSIGKEAWMILSLGLASWGAAAIFRHRPSGYALLGLGIAGTALPRPHIAIVVLAAAAVGFAVAALFGGHGHNRAVGLATKLIGVLFLLTAGALLAPKVATFLNIDDVGGSGFSDTLDDVQQQTSQGGSAFNAPEINSPLDYPWALVTVLFRPFPYEVSNAATLISSLEGLLLLGLMAVSLRRLRRLPASLVQHAYVTYAAAFTFMFVYVFAFIGNFGILARQRTQLLPFLFVLLAISSAADRPRPPAHDAQTTVRPVHTAPVLAPPRPRS